MNVCAVLVTRGDVDMEPILDSLPADWDRLVWDNSEGPDLAVYGRYAGIGLVPGADAIYVQDDDCVVSDPAALAAAFEALGRTDALVANMPNRFRLHYSSSCLVGFGAVFHRDLPELMFERFTRHHYHSPGEAPPWGPFLLRVHPTFRRTCDVVLTALALRQQLDLPYKDREFASDPGRMWKQATHVQERKAMLEMAHAAARDER